MVTVVVGALKPEAATLALRAAERVEAGTLAKASDAETMAVASGASCGSDTSAVTCTDTDTDIDVLSRKRQH